MPSEFEEKYGNEAGIGRLMMDTSLGGLAVTMDERYAAHRAYRMHGEERAQFVSRWSRRIVKKAAGILSREEAGRLNWNDPEVRALTDHVATEIRRFIRMDEEKGGDPMFNRRRE